MLPINAINTIHIAWGPNLKCIVKLCEKILPLFIERRFINYASYASFRHVKPERVKEVIAYF
jgi:hypothetical protein